jgi:hypothetical protein
MTEHTSEFFATEEKRIEQIEKNEVLKLYQWKCEMNMQVFKPFYNSLDTVDLQIVYN